MSSSCCPKVKDGKVCYEGPIGQTVRVVLQDENCQYWTGTAWAASTVAAIDGDGFQAAPESCNDGAKATYCFQMPPALLDRTGANFRRNIRVTWSTTAGESWSVAGAVTNKCNSPIDMLEDEVNCCEIELRFDKECYEPGETARAQWIKKCCGKLTDFVGPAVINTATNDTIPSISVSTGAREITFTIPAGDAAGTLYSIRATETLAPNEIRDAAAWLRVCAPKDPFDRLCGTGVITAKVAGNYAPDTFGNRLCQDPFDRLCSTGVITPKTGGVYSTDTIGAKLCATTNPVDPLDALTTTGVITPKVAGAYAPGTAGACLNTLCTTVPNIIPAVTAARDSILTTGGAGPWQTGTPGGTTVDPFDRNQTTGVIVPKVGGNYAPNTLGACLSSVCTTLADGGRTDNLIDAIVPAVNAARDAVLNRGNIAWITGSGSTVDLTPINQKLDALPGTINSARDAVLNVGGTGPWTQTTTPTVPDPFDRDRITGQVLTKVNNAYAPTSLGNCLASACSGSGSGLKGTDIVPNTTGGTGAGGAKTVLEILACACCEQVEVHAG